MAARTKKLPLVKVLGSPKDCSARALRVHGRRVAKTMGLTREQAAVLCNEIRNALCPLGLVIDTITPGVARSDARRTLRRVLAIVEAIERPHFGPPPVASPPGIKEASLVPSVGRRCRKGQPYVLSLIDSASAPVAIPPHGTREPEADV